MPAKVLQVTVSAGSEEEAERIATVLVERRLAACVQVFGPVTSRYRWQGDVETAAEWLCLAKTTQTVWPALRDAVCELHSYEVPEVIAVAVERGSDAYLEWVRAECRAEPED